MNKIYKLLIMIICLLPIRVFATNQYSEVWSGTNIYTCTSKYQDKSISTSGSLYFSHCMEARCESNNNYKLSYYSRNAVTCNNGNKDPYVQSINTSKCDNLGSCRKGDIKYCSIILYYDCSRTSSGSIYQIPTTSTTTKKTTTTKRTTTTKKTTKRTTKRTTIKTTTKVTTTVLINTKLKSLFISSGNINFKPEVYEYTIEVNSNINSINITALPQDSNSTVEIKNNTNIVNGSVISIIVTGSDKNFTEYKINVNKKEKLKSSNANLNSLTINEYPISFDKTINEYNITLKEELSKLTIDYEVEDENSVVKLEGNSNIVNGSKVKVFVTAEDGTENTYTINVSIKKKSNALKTIFIIILILAMLAGAYYVYVKFIQNKKSGDKYEYE